MKKVTKIVSLALLITSLATSACWADGAPVVVKAGDRSFTAVAPAGTCAYDRANAMDANIIAMLERGNRGYNYLALAFAGCADIEAMHQGKLTQASGDYGQLLSPINASQTDGVSRRDMVSKIADYYRKNAGVFEEGTKIAQQRLQSLVSDELKVGDIKILGVIKTDPDFVQVGMLQTLQTGDKPVVIAGVITTTKLGIPVSINLYHPYKDETSLTELSQRAADYTRTLIALNPEVSANTTLAHADERKEDDKRVMMAVIAGAVIAAGLAIFLIVRKRKQS